MQPQQNQKKQNNEGDLTQNQKQLADIPKQQTKQIGDQEKNKNKSGVQKSNEKQTIESNQNSDLFKKDEEGTTTKAQLTLTQKRDPIHPNQTKNNNEQVVDKKEERNQVQKSQQKGEKPQQLSFPDYSKNTHQRPISINLGKQTIQMEKQSVVLFKQPEVKLQIKQYFQKGFTLNKQIFYRITGFDKHGHIDIQRNVQQFQSLRKILLERWPGCFVPNISLKSELRNQNLRNLHKRKNLESFLRKLSYCEEIYYKQEIQLFLRCVGINIQQMFNQMPILKVRDVIERLKTCFGQIVEAPNSPDNATNISHFSTSLKKIANNLQNLAKRALKLAQSYQIYQQKIPLFSKFLSHYQQACFSQYANNPDSSIALKDLQGKINKINIVTQRKNIFYDLYFLLETETRDAQSLSDVILAMEMFNIKRDELQTQIRQKRMQIDQISLGQTNFKVMTSRKTKQVVQAQLQQREKFLISEKHLVNQLKNMSQIVLATFTIPIFKKMKIQNYYSVLKNWVEVVGQTNIQIYEVWKYLNQEGKTQLKKDKSK